MWLIWVFFPINLFLGESYITCESGPIVNDLIAVEDSIVAFLDVEKCCMYDHQRGKIIEKF